MGLYSIFSVSGEVVRSFVCLFLVMVMLMVTGEEKGGKERKLGGRGGFLFISFKHSQAHDFEFILAN